MEGMRRLRRLARVSAIAAVAMVAVLALPLGAGAKEESRDWQQFRGPIEVREGETVGNVNAFSGPITIRGRVEGDVAVFRGPVEIWGEVRGDVVSLRGPVTLHEGARVRGEVIHGGPLTVAPGAVVEGRSHRVDLGSIGRRAGTVTLPTRTIGRLGWWVGISVLTLALGFIVLALGPRAQEALVEAARSHLGRSIAWGAALWVGLPVLTVGSFITLIGIPLGLALGIAMTILYPFAYAVSEWVLGRLLIRGQGRPIAALLAGWAILRALALVPVVAGAVWLVATLLGLGVCAVAVRAARRPSPAVPGSPAGVGSAAPPAAGA